MILFWINLFWNAGCWFFFIILWEFDLWWLRYSLFKKLQCYLQICVTTSTSAGLEQILPWIFYHKVMGVSIFFLFVEGKASKSNVATVLESIPVSLILYFYLLLWFLLVANYLLDCDFEMYKHKQSKTHLIVPISSFEFNQVTTNLFIFELINKPLSFSLI